MDRDGICSIPDTSRVTPCLTYHRDDIQLFLRNIAPQEFTQKQIFPTHMLKGSANRD